MAKVGLAKHRGRRKVGSKKRKLRSAKWKKERITRGGGRLGLIRDATEDASD